MPDSRGWRRLAVGLWLALGLSVWNVVFDYEIRTAADRYLYMQTMYASGRGPRVGIDDVMRPAQAHGALIATIWGSAIVIAGLAAIAFSRGAPRR